jgi:hypothetical protein
MHPDAAAGRLTDRQLGLITTAQAIGCGLTMAQVKHRAKTGRLVRVHVGVYRTPGSRENLEQRALAACFAAGPTSVISHACAARIFGLIQDDPRTEITVAPSVRPRLQDVVVHRADVPRQDRTRRGILPVTSIRRTLLDLAGQVGEGVLAAAVDKAMIDRLTQPSALAAYLRTAACATKAGSDVLRSIVDDRIGNGVPESELERLMVALLDEFGLPVPDRQYAVVVGGRRLRFDLAYPDQRLALELDGRAAHLSGSHWQSDHDRHNATELGEWSTLRFTWRDVSARQVYVALTVATALGLRPTRWRNVLERPSRHRNGTSRTHVGR